MIKEISFEDLLPDANTMGRAKLKKIARVCDFLNKSIIPLMKQHNLERTTKSILSAAQMFLIVREQANSVGRNAQFISYSGKAATLNKEAFFEWYMKSPEGEAYFRNMDEANPKKLGKSVYYR